MTKLLIVFILLNILNVIIQTVKSLVTIKCGKGLASLVNAIAYGLYTIVTVFMLCELNLFLKAFIVAMCNLVGVYVVKLIEEKTRKDKLLKVEVTTKNNFSTDLLQTELENSDIPFNYIDLGKYTLFNIYCATQKESRVVKMFIDKLDAKYFVTETKTLF
jgi:uncharacterized protein YebE (UPF0316 family)